MKFSSWNCFEVNLQFLSNFLVCFFDSKCSIYLWSIILIAPYPRQWVEGIHVSYLQILFPFPQDAKLRDAPLIDLLGWYTRTWTPQGYNNSWYWTPWTRLPWLCASSISQVWTCMSSTWTCRKRRLGALGSPLLWDGARCAMGSRGHTWTLICVLSARGCPRMPKLDAHWYYLI